jgi:hypothetical protein
MCVEEPHVNRGREGGSTNTHPLIAPEANLAAQTVLLRNVSGAEP